MSVGSAETPRDVTASDIDAVYRVVDDARRNFLITLTYNDLSRHMQRLVGPDGTWCTFSTWSSRTIGYFIRGDLDPLTEHRLAATPPRPQADRPLPRRAREPADQPLTAPRRAAAARTRKPRDLRRVATEFARFVATFDGTGDRDAVTWRVYRTTIAAGPATDLFPAAPVDLMRDGFEAYYEAIYERDPRRRSELVLLGNMLLADYEQQRVDPIVRAAMSLFPSRLLNDDPDDPELLTVRKKKPWALQDTGRFRTWIDETYGRLVTRWRMAIVLPSGVTLATHSELIRVGIGLPKPLDGADLYTVSLRELQDPEVIAAWARHDRARGSYRRARRVRGDTSATE